MTQFFEEILQQPEALKNTAAYYRTAEGRKAVSDFCKAVRGSRRVVATGMGSSYFLSGTLQALAACSGVAVEVVNAGELLHYQLNALSDDTLLVAISQSGESYETVNIVNRLKENGCNLKLAVLTNEPSSTLGRSADILLPTYAGVEEKTSTKTFITAYQVLYILGLALCGESPADNLWQSIADSIAQLLERREEIASILLPALGEAPYLQFVARGATLASASQSALMAMEASHTPAQAMAGGEFRHGPLEMVQDGFVALLLAHSQDNTYNQTLRLVEDILRYGGRVIIIGDEGVNLPDRDGLTVVKVKSPVVALHGIPALIPVQIAIEAWARRVKGITPGIFTHGAKVTAIE